MAAMFSVPPNQPSIDGFHRSGDTAQSVERSLYIRASSAIGCYIWRRCGSRARRLHNSRRRVSF